MDYKYKVKLIKVINENTIEFEVDLGFQVKTFERFKLYKVNNLEEKAKDYIEELLKEVDNIYVKTYKTDSFGRYLADVFYEVDNMYYSLNKKLIIEELAKEYKK